MALLWKVVLAVSVIAVLALSLAISKFVTRFKRRKNKERAIAACKTMQHESIFVVLVSHKDAFGAAQTLFSLFAKAECPLRVYVGLYEFYDPESADSVMAVFESFVKRSPEVAFSMQDHVRLLRAPATEFTSGPKAREHVQRFLYRNELYVLCVGRSCTLSGNWDGYLVAMHKMATKGKSKGSGNVVLTTRPAVGGGAASGAREGTFIAFGDFKGDFPSMVAYEMKRSATVKTVVPALLWSAQLSFSKGVVPYPAAHHLQFSNDQEDLIMTFRLLDAGWTLFHPAKEVCRIRSAAASLPIIDRTRFLMAYTPLLQRLGANVPRKRLTTRARLGLLPDDNKRVEIESKIGSQGDLLSLLSRIESKVETQ